MKLDSLDLVYFSPTGTTRTVLEGIAEGLGAEKVLAHDLTPPDAEKGSSIPVQNDLTLIGVPVYAGRVPMDAVRRLQKVQGNGSPALVVVVYGNRDFDDALLELRDLAVERGFVPIAAAAFIGEHSFSTEEKPIAPGRPDKQDLEQARDFGTRVREKLAGVSSIEELETITVPGNYPYREYKAPAQCPPVTYTQECNLCEACVDVCPTGAIVINSDTVVTNEDLCIACCACVKACPSEARVMENERILQINQKLYDNFRQRKSPEVFCG